ncbi:MAG: cobalamin-binding protein [Wenzhouxiangellaceae bacterium]|nr:cobalamin-binding protein [Wenzhouxiangellaceae bacterium]
MSDCTRHFLPAPMQLVMSMLAIGCLGWPAGGEAREPEPAEPPRVVSLAPHLTELAFEAGIGDLLVGAVEWSDYPPAALDLPRIGDAFRFDLEKIVRLDASHALAWQGGTPAAAIERLTQLGIDVRVLSVDNLDQIGVAIETLAALADRPARGLDRASEFRQRIADMERSIPTSGSPVDVFYQVSKQPLFTLGGRHVINEIFRLCNARNIFAELDSAAANVDLEAVIARNPDAIVIGTETRDHSLSVHWRDYPRLRAVRCGHLLEVDPALLVRPTTRVLDGARQLCDWLDQRANQVKDPTCAIGDE